jgi:hypothetical protein
MQKSTNLNDGLRCMNRSSIKERLIALCTPNHVWAFNSRKNELLYILYSIFHLRPWQVRTASFEEYGKSSADSNDDIVIIFSCNSNSVYVSEQICNISEFLQWYRYNEVDSTIIYDNVHLNWKVVYYSRKHFISKIV